MKYCKVCGISSNKRTFVKDVCNKHYQQYLRYGKYKDNIQRGSNDPNEIILYNTYAEIILYNQNNIEVNRAKIDIEDVEKCSKYKWRINNKSTKMKTKLYCYTGSGKGNQIPLHRFITDCDNGLEVDHINADTLDCRKINLRIVTHNQNLLNKEVRDYKDIKISGVYYNKSKDLYKAEISKLGRRYYLRDFKKLEEAVYARYLLEIELFGDLRNVGNDEVINSYIHKLSEKERFLIEEYLKKKGLLNED